MATYTEIHIRRDSTLNWYASNPRLALGEPGVDMDLHRFKIGNGIDRWNQLPYMDDDLYKQLDEQAQETADRVQDLLNKIQANKLDADTKHNAVTTELRNTSRELQGQMAAVEEEQSEYEESLTSRQDEYEESLTGEFEETKAEVHAGLDEFNETRDKLNIRMDVIAGQATEDTEILDARVDAEYQTHPNLGANIRSIHEQLISAEQIQEADKAELEEEIAGLKSADEVHDERLSTVEDKAEKLSEHGEFLQNEIDTNAEAILRTQIYLSDEAFRSRENDTEHSAEIARLSRGLEEERAARENECSIRKEADSELRAEDESIRLDLQNLTERLTAEEQDRRKDTEIVRKSTALRDDHQQEQLDELAGVVISETIRVRKDSAEQKLELTQKLSEEQGSRERADIELHQKIEDTARLNLERDDHLQRQIEHTALLSLERDEHQQEQVDELATGLMLEVQTRQEGYARQEQELARVMSEEREERYSEDDQLQRKIENTTRSSSERDDHQQEQLDELAGVIISEVMRNREERQARLQKEETLRAEDEALRTEIAGAGRRSSERAEHLQGQADELAGSVLRLIHQRLGDQKENTAQQERETSRRIVGDEHLQEQVDMTAQGVLGLVGALSHEAKQRRALEDVVAGITSPVDWSKTEALAIPEPRCAIVNFSGLASMPTSKTVDIPAVLEFWDLQGNYFRKPIVCSAQGSSSMGYVKKNVKVDLLNEDGSEFDLKIGNWVAQDGFHLKAYYTDFFRGIGVTSYKFWDEVMRFNGLDKDRPYKKVMINTSSIHPSGTDLNNPDDFTLQFDNGALCHPDGFPCIVYLNGTFYGVYSWQLKKHRKNYRMDKGTVEHIHLDGSLNASTFFGGSINWTVFEVRNPNKLYTMDGKKYDGDAPQELIDETSEKFDPTNKDHVRTARVKGYILDLVNRFNEFKQAPTREGYEALFDWENQRDYLIFSDIVSNRDGFSKNWQWTTYDGVKWFVNAYDLDMTYGGMHNGSQITAPLTGHVTTSKDLPTYYVALLYQDELEMRYRELRDAGIISVDNIIAKLADWTARIGVGNYELEYQRWPSSPCILNYTDSVYRVRKWLEVEISNMDKVYNYEAVTPQDLIDELHETHEVDVRTLKASDEGGARIREAVDAGLQEQINELSGLILRKVLDEIEERRKREADSSHEIQSRQADIEHQQEQTNELAGAVLCGMLNSYRAREKIMARIKTIEEALIEDGILDEDDIPRYTDDDVDGMLEGIFSGEGSGSEPDISDETDQEFYEDINQIFNP